MAEELKIVIDADVSQAQAGLNSISDSANKTATSLKGIAPAANASLGATSTQVKAVTLSVSKLGDTIETLRAKALAKRDFINTERDVAKIAILNKEIQALEAEITRVQNIGKAGINIDTSSLVSGANGAFSALRKIAFILPGIGVAGILNFGVNLVESFFKIGEQADKTKDQLEELKKTLDDLKSASDIKIESTGSVQGDVEKVNALAAAVRDTNLSYGERKRALEDLQAINKSYFGDLTLEATSLETLTGRVNEYTQALIQAAVVKGFQDQISKFAPELSKANKALSDNAEAVKKWQDILSAFKQTPEFLNHNSAQQIEDIGSFATKNIDIFKKYQDAQKAIITQTPELQKARAAYADIEDAIQGAVQESLKFKPLTTTAATVDTKGLDEAQRKLIELAKKAQEIFNVPLKLRFDDSDLDIQKLQKAEQIFKAIADHTIRLNVIVPDKIELPKLTPEVDKPFFKKQLDDFVKNLNVELKVKLIPQSFLEQLDDLKRKLSEEFKFDPKNITQSLSDISKLILTDKELQDSLKLSLSLDADPAKFAKALNDIKQFLPKALVGKLDIALEKGDIDTTGVLQGIAKMNEDISKALNNTLVELGTDFGTLIGESIEALSGGDISKAFENFGKALGSAVEALGKQIIALGVATALAKTALKSFNPVVTIAAGIALVAIGEALKNLIGGGLKGFAKGGRYPVGEDIIVGEKGPEIVRFDRPGTILTNQQSQSILSSSVKEHETVREYFIANKVADQLKEYFSRSFSEKIKEGIRLSLVESKIFETVKNFSVSNDKVSSYVYKLFKESFSSDKKSEKILDNRFTDRSFTESFSDKLSKEFHSHSSIEKLKSLFSSNKENNNSESATSNITRSFDKIYSSIVLKVQSLVSERYNNTVRQSELISSYGKPILSSHYENFLKEKFTSDIEKLKEGFYQTSIGKFFTNSTLKEGYFNELKSFTNLKERFSETKENTKSFTQKAESLKDHFSKSFERVKESFYKESFFSDSFSNSEKYNEISVSKFEKLSTVTNSLKEVFSNSIQKIFDSVKNLNTDKKFVIENLVNNFSVNSIKDISTKSFSLERLSSMFGIPKFAQGGAVFGPTLAILGEGFGISRSNPEVVGTLGQLQNIAGGNFNFNHNFDGQFTVSGADLLLILNRANKSSQRTG
jgi:hypothetical protein